MPKPDDSKKPAAAAEEQPVEKKKEKKEKKSQKERPKSKKKHASVQVWKLYEKDGKRKRENCPRCGPGTFLAVFKNRKYCGKCGWAQVQNTTS